MRTLFRLLPLVLGLAALAPPAHAREIVGKGDTVDIALSGEISPPLHLYLRRAIKAAENAGASAIIIEMDTYGGLRNSPRHHHGPHYLDSRQAHNFINI